MNLVMNIIIILDYLELFKNTQNIEQISNNEIKQLKFLNIYIIFWL